MDQQPRILKKKLIMVYQRMKVVDKLCNQLQVSKSILQAKEGMFIP